jgi:hypothetical protein
MSEERPQAPLGRRRVESLLRGKEAVAAVAREVTTDPEQREEFLADPAAFLRRAGAEIPGDIQLTDRDRDIIRIVTDPEMVAIYQSGDVERLREHLRANYPTLVPDPTKVAWTVADFEVAVEAVVVAVGVAFVPVAPVYKVSEVARLEAVVNARLAGQEARLRALEERLGGQPG